MIRVLYAVVAILLAGGAQAKPPKPPEDVLIPPAASALRVIQLDIGSTGVQRIGFAGRIRIAGTIRYGRMDPSVDELEMQFEPSGTDERSLPRYRSCIGVPCHDTFVLQNPEAFALQLFGAAAVKGLASGETQSLQVYATLVLQNLSFGSDCGVHYRAAIAMVKPPLQTQVTKGPGVKLHC